MRVTDPEVAADDDDDPAPVALRHTMNFAHFARRWDNYVLIVTFVVTTSTILQLQLLTQYPQQRYPRYSAEYSERIIVDKYVRQEILAPDMRMRAGGGLPDPLVDSQQMSPFELDMQKRAKRKPVVEEPPEEPEDEEEERRKKLPLCDIPKYTKFKPCRIEVVARPAPAKDTPDWEVKAGPWRGYITVDSKEIYKWKTPPAFVVFNIDRDCKVKEALDFSDPNDAPYGYANFSMYFDKLPNKTVLAGVAYGQSQSILGLTVFGIDRWYLSKQPDNGILPFVGWKGYPGHTRFIMDKTGNSSATIKTNFHIGNPFNYTIDGISYPTAIYRHRDMTSPGGFWQPPNCRARWSLALIVPYRKREHHLYVFVDNMIRFLQLQKIAFQIFIVDQSEPDLFNRAALMNIGFLEAKQIRNFDCYAFHDVDLVPEDLANSYECTDHPRHLAVTRRVTNYRLRFEFYFGGAISMKPDQIEKINGFPNRLFGWGGEDDEIFARVNFTKMNILRYPLEIGRYISLPHGEDKGNPHVPRVADSILSNVSRVIYEDGLNSMNYTVLGVERRALFTQVLVRIPGPSRMEDLPDYVPPEVLEQQRLEKLEKLKAEKNKNSGGKR